MRVEYVGDHVAVSPESSNNDVYHCALQQNEWITEVKFFKGPNGSGERTSIIGLEFLTNRNRSCGVHGSESEAGYDVAMASGHQLLAMHAYWWKIYSLRRIRFYFDYDCRAENTFFLMS